MADKQLEQQPRTHTFVDSTRVSSATWYPESRELVVEFPDGNRTRYYAVAERVFDELCTAPSAGQYLNQVLTRQHRYGPA